MPPARTTPATSSCRCGCKPHLILFPGSRLSANLGSPDPADLAFTAGALGPQGRATDWFHVEHGLPERKAGRCQACPTTSRGSARFVGAISWRALRAGASRRCISSRRSRHWRCIGRWAGTSRAASPASGEVLRRGLLPTRKSVPRGTSSALPTRLPSRPPSETRGGTITIPLEPLRKSRGWFGVRPGPEAPPANEWAPQTERNGGRHVESRGATVLELARVRAARASLRVDPLGNRDGSAPPDVPRGTRRSIDQRHPDTGCEGESRGSTWNCQRTMRRMRTLGALPLGGRKPVLSAHREENPCRC